MKDTPQKIEVGLVENDEAYVQELTARLKVLPEIKNIHSWPSAELFWRDRKRGRLDLLFLDILLTGMNGVELAGMVADRHPKTSIVMLSNLASDALVFQALRNGAIGYLIKSDVKDVGETVRTILAGGAPITPTIALRVLTSFRKADPIAQAHLTNREKQILELMVKGATSARVAEILGSSVHTVNFHAKNIYRKLNVRNRVELAHKATAAGMLSGEMDTESALTPKLDNDGDDTNSPLPAE